MNGLASRDINKTKIECPELGHFRKTAIETKSVHQILKMRGRWVGNMSLCDILNPHLGGTFAVLEPGIFAKVMEKLF